MNKYKDSNLRLGELLPVPVAFKTSHTALEADCPGNSGTKQEVPFTKLTLESHPLLQTPEQRGLRTVWQRTAQPFFSLKCKVAQQDFGRNQLHSQVEIPFDKGFHAKRQNEL